jgi:hypothetical protein
LNARHDVVDLARAVLLGRGELELSREMCGDLILRECVALDCGRSVGALGQVELSQPLSCLGGKERLGDMLDL